MAGSRDLILIGPVTVSVGDYVTAKGAGTNTDVGYIIGNVSVDSKQEHHLVDVQQHLTPVRAVPIKRGEDIKVPMAEGDVEKLRLAMGQPTGNVSGTGQNKTILVDPDAAEQYHQVVLTGVGPGTTKVRTRTYYRCYVSAIEAVTLQKAGEAIYTLTFSALYEETGTGNDDLYKQVDA